MKNICSKCKSQIEENSKFCTKCGNAIRDTVNKPNGIKFEKEEEFPTNKELDKQHMMSAGQWYLGFIVIAVLWGIFKAITSWL